MSKQEIIKQLKLKNPSLNHSDLEKVLENFCTSIRKALKNNEKIELREFGTFFLKRIKEKHSARNPKTGELIYVPEKNKVRFKPSKKLKIKVNET